MAEQALKFDDVNEGDEAQSFTHKLTRTDLVRYAGASGDFNPMHHDDTLAQAAGLPSVFGHGMFTMGILGKALTDYVGVGNLKSYSVRFTKQTWPDEELSTKIVVTSKTSEGDSNLIEMACSVVNAEGQEKVSGTATAAAV